MHKLGQAIGILMIIVGVVVLAIAVLEFIDIVTQ